MAFGQESISFRGVVSPDELSGPGGSVKPENLPAAAVRGVDFASGAVLAAVRGVVVEADDFDIVVLREPARVVLEAELGVIGDAEVATLTVKAPNNRAVGIVNFVEGVGVARGDKVVAGGVLSDAIDVEVVLGV